MEMNFVFNVLFLVAMAVQRAESQAENSTTASVETTTAYKSWNFLKDEINPLIVPVASIVALAVLVCLGWFCCFRHAHMRFCNCKLQKLCVKARVRVQKDGLLDRTPDSADRKKTPEKARTIFVNVVKYIWRRSPENRYCTVKAVVLPDDMKHSIV